MRCGKWVAASKEQVKGGEEGRKKHEGWRRTRELSPCGGDRYTALGCFGFA